MVDIRLLLTAFLTIILYGLSAQVAININGTGPDTSAILDVKSTSKGFLLPRMTQSEIAAISSPANGLTVFNTDDSRFYFFDMGAGEWKELAIGTGTIAPIPVVTNPITGEIWMDRNLGASQVATSSTDDLAYGHLYQWGRASDGHEMRTSGTFPTIADTAAPNLGNGWDGLYILESDVPEDWVSPQDNTLWQGPDGMNNPCPNGFRLPTETEWDAERQSWSTNNAAGAFASPLKLTLGGHRSQADGSFPLVGIYGFYWSSSVYGTESHDLYFYSGSAYMGNNKRAMGHSVRCIKD